MAHFSLKQTLANIAPGVPAGFDATKGIASLFPPKYAGTISELTNYHFLFTDSRHAGGVTCPFTIDVWGSGKYHFFGKVNNVDFLNADYAIGFFFNFAPGGQATGDVASGSAGPRSTANFDHSGSNLWVKNNWIQAFASGVNDDLKVSENLGEPLDSILKGFAEAVGIAGFAFLMLLTGGQICFSPVNGDWQRVPCPPDPEGGPGPNV
jgi:hypothetical protein